MQGMASHAHRGFTKHSLRQREKEELTEMITMAVPLATHSASLEQPPPSTDKSEAVWRLLIFDDWGRDIIAPLLKVGELRELGVTLYMHIKTERDPVPGAPAIYFCAPTEENVSRIAQDCASELYEWVYVNFTTQVPRHQLEVFAQALASTRLASIHHIRVFDRTLSYVALADDLFSLMLPNSYAVLNKRQSTEAEIETHVKAMVLGISHVLFSLQTLPVIVHTKTGATEEVARRLTVHLQDAMNDRYLTPNSTATLGRTLLVLVDRASDLAPALHHPFTYRGLLVEVGGMRLNKCMVHTTEGGDEVLEVDPDRDEFYSANALQDFSAVGGNLEAALLRYKEEYAALAETTAAGDDDDDAGGNTMSRLLASAPLLAERKRYLDSHTKLAYGFLNSIRQNHLDRFNGVELSLLHREGLDKEEFARLMRGSGSVQDRQRLYLIGYLMCPPGSEEESFVTQQLPHLDGEPFPALDYLKHVRQWSLGIYSPTSQQPSASQGFGWGFAQQVAKNIVSTLGGSEETELPLTKLVDALLQDAPAAQSGYHAGNGTQDRARLLESVVAYDPRTKQEVNLNTTYFSQAIVVAIGGGSIAEYDDLKRWEAMRPTKAVSYGCTAVTSGEEMLQQLSLLGAESQ